MLGSMKIGISLIHGGAGRLSRLEMTIVCSLQGERRDHHERGCSRCFGKTIRPNQSRSADGENVQENLEWSANCHIAKSCTSSNDRSKKCRRRGKEGPISKH